MKPDFSAFTTTGGKPLEVIKSKFDNPNTVLDMYSRKKAWGNREHQWKNTPKKVKKFLIRKGLKRKGDALLGVINVWNQAKLVTTPLFDMDEHKSIFPVYINGEEGEMTFDIPYKIKI